MLQVVKVWERFGNNVRSLDATMNSKEQGFGQ
jgi:hypothetical protein